MINPPDVNQKDINIKIPVEGMKKLKGIPWESNVTFKYPLQIEWKTTEKYFRFNRYDELVEVSKKEMLIRKAVGFTIYWVCLGITVLSTLYLCFYLLHSLLHFP
jgi:hypothetical protein